jgi:hypothetical protein
MSSAHFPELPVPGTLIDAFDAWHYPGGPGSMGGTGELRVWRTDCGHLAIITQLGTDTGISVTNAAEYVYQELASKYPLTGEMVLIEHYPPGDDNHAVWDQVAVDPAGQPRWRPVWPIPEEHPDFERHHAWVAAHGQLLGITS